MSACAAGNEPTGSVRISNLSGATLSGLELHSGQDWRQKVRDLDPGEQVTVQLGWDSPPGEGDVKLLDSERHFDYLVVAYFEEPAVGSADVRIKQLLEDGRMVVDVRDMVTSPLDSKYEQAVPDAVNPE